MTIVKRESRAKSNWNHLILWGDLDFVLDISSEQTIEEMFSLIKILAILFDYILSFA